MRSAWPLVLLTTTLFALTTGFEWEGRLARLRRQLGSEDASTRSEAVRLLSHYRAEEARPALLEALEDPHPAVRTDAANAVGTLRLREAVPTLITWLSDESPEVRAAAAEGLGRIGDTSALGPLVRALGDAAADVRRAAVRALTRLGTADVLVPILGRLDDIDTETRVVAASSLALLGDTRAVVPLIGRSRDQAPEVRAAAYAALGALGDRRGVGALLQGVRDSVEDVRLAAISALGTLGSDADVDSLASLETFQDPRTPRTVAAALGAIGTPRAVEELVELLYPGATRDVAARMIARAAARLSESERSTIAERVNSLIENTSDPDYVVALARTLAVLTPPDRAATVVERTLRVLDRSWSPLARQRIGSPLLAILADTAAPEGLVPLLERIEDEDPEPALDALARYFEGAPADGRAADPLIAALGVVAPALRVKVVRLLGLLRAHRAIESLLPLLAHSDRLLRLEAVRAIGAIGSEGDFPALLTLLDSGDAELRFMAAETVGRTAPIATVVSLMERVRDPSPRDRHAVLHAIGSAVRRLSARGPLPAHVRASLVRLLEEASEDEDVRLASRAVDAMSQWNDPSLFRPLIALARSGQPRIRPLAILALGNFTSRDAREVLRSTLAADPHLAAAAAAALASHGDATDARAVLDRARTVPWPASITFAYAITRLAERGIVRAESRQELCALALSRHAFVRANAGLALGAIGGATCDAPTADPRSWLAPSHAIAVRMAAASWLEQAKAGGPLHAADVDPLLAHCASSDPVAEVTRVCSHLSDTDRSGEADIYAYGPEGDAPLTNEWVSIRFADGSVIALRTDANAHLRVAAVPSGPLVLDDLYGTPLEP